MGQLTTIISGSTLNNLYTSGVDLMAQAQVPPGIVPLVYAVFLTFVPGSTAYVAPGGATLGVSYNGGTTPAVSPISASLCTLSPGANIGKAFMVPVNVLFIPDASHLWLTLSAAWTTNGNGTLTATLMFHDSPGISTN